MKDELNPEVVEQARALYVAGGVTLEQIAEQSKSLFGQEIPYETLRVIARNNSKIWTVERNAETSDISGEVDEIRRIIFEQIVTESQEGYFVALDDLDRAEEVYDMLFDMQVEYPGAIKGDIKRIKPRGVDHNLVNAYMNLLSKSKIDINIGASAKTSFEQVVELIEGVNSAD